MIRPVLRLAVAVTAAMLLSSCWWVGPPLYTGDPADAGPVKPGVYKVDILGDGHPGRTLRIAWQPDGTIRVTPLKPRKDEEPSSTIMVRFAASGRDLWIMQEGAAEGQTDVSYGLAELHGDVLWALPVIDCDSTVAIVRAAGGDVEDEAAGNVEDSDVATTNSMQGESTVAAKPVGGATCRFKNRASLERALRAYIASNPRFVARMRFKRIGD